MERLATPVPDVATRQVTEIFNAFRYFAQMLNARNGLLRGNFGDLTGQQLRTLRVLAAGPLSMGALSARLYVQASTVSGMVDRLETKGLVRRRRSEADRRRVEVELTAAGTALLASAPVSVVQTVLDRLHELPATELEDLHHAVGRMHALLSSTVVEVCGTGATNGRIA